MSARFQTVVEAGKDVAEYLDSIGQHKMANDVRRVCRSNTNMRSALRSTNKALRHLTNAAAQDGAQ